MAFFPCTCLIFIQNTPLYTKQWCALFHMFFFSFLAIWTCTYLVQKILSMVCHSFCIPIDAENLLSKVLIFLVLRQNFGSSEISVENKNPDSDSCNQQCCNEKVDGKLHREEVEIVMRKLGFSCSPKGEELKEWMGSDELSQLFAEKEPSLEEVREAFDFFDDNKDGFIDAKELQRVLCLLGLKERSELENCRKMIKHFDQNGDDRIDLNEFTRFMETSFCK